MQDLWHLPHEFWAKAIFMRIVQVAIPLKSDKYFIQLNFLNFIF